MRILCWRRPAVLVVVLMMLVGSTSCRSLLAPEPDLERLYAAHAGGVRTPVIVIPGVFGSSLATRRTWP